MPYPQVTTYCSVCRGAYALMDDGRCGACSLIDPPLPPLGGWAMGHVEANDDIAKEFKAAWERFHREAQARLDARLAREAAEAEWLATGEAGVRARWI